MNNLFSKCWLSKNVMSQPEAVYGLTFCECQLFVRPQTCGPGSETVPKAWSKDCCLLNHIYENISKAEFLFPATSFSALKAATAA